MLAFQLAGKGDLLSTRNGYQFASSEIKAYAARGAGGALTLTVVNKSGDPVSPTVAVSGSTRSWHASMVRLAAPGIEAKANVTLGRAEVTSTGTWKASRPEMVAVSGDRFHLTVPAASAAIVTIV